MGKLIFIKATAHPSKKDIQDGVMAQEVILPYTAISRIESVLGADYLYTVVFRKDIDYGLHFVPEYISSTIEQVSLLILEEA